MSQILDDGSSRLVRKKKDPIAVNASSCKYEVVKECAINNGFKLVNDIKCWSLFWIDTGVSLERILGMDPYQKINHFPGMSEICRKNLLSRNLTKIQKRKEFDFFPRSWILPSEWSDFNLNYRRNDRSVFIVKPDQGCQGKGIFLAKNPKHIIKLQKKNGTTQSDVVVQKYVCRPYLIDGFKFDLRIYVLVTSMEPLRIFVYNEGLARFATEPYSDPKIKNFSNLYMHLTNYAINKTSEKFDKTEDGSKRSMSSVFRLLESKGVDVTELWKNICNALVKTLLIVQPQITKIMSVCFPKERCKKTSKTTFGSQCFEILGFDVLIDSTLTPWVLEVNHSPSFATDAELDLKIKSSLITDTLNLLNVKSSTQKHFEKYQKKQSQKRLWNFSSAPRSLNRSNSTNVNDASNVNDPLQDLRNIHFGDMARKLQLYEDSNMGNFSRIFPPDNQELLDSYLNLLLYLTPLMNTQNSGTISTKIRMEYLMSKKSVEELKQAKYQEWKDKRSSSNSSFSVDGSQKSFKINSILRNSPPDIKPRNSISQLKKAGMEINVQNITYPGCIGRIA